MKNKITVVIAIYNPDMRKLKATIKSVLKQRNIDYSIVLADDGSKEGIDWASIELLLRDYSFKDYSIVKNEINLGTVKNLYSGLEHIDSEYVFTISPGDMLFDDDTLFDIYEFCKEKKECSFFFGKAIYYLDDAGILSVGETLFPKLPHIYDYKSFPWLITSTAFFSRQHICGASYFYRTQEFKKYVKEIIDIGIKYVEDYTTAAIYILDNNQVTYFDRNVVWYESNTGVSGSRDKKWDIILNEDILRLKDYLKENYGQLAIVDAKFGGVANRIKHPVIGLIAASVITVSRFIKNHPSISTEDIARAKDLLY